MDNIKTIFVDLYQDQVKNPYTSNVECEKFDVYFDQQLRELEGSTDATAPALNSPEQLTPPSSSDGGVDEAPPPIPGLKGVSEE